MIKSIKTFAAALAAVLALQVGTADAATTVNVGDNIGDFGVVNGSISGTPNPGFPNAGNPVSFDYEAGEDLKIMFEGFSLTSNGFTAGADIASLTYRLLKNGSEVLSSGFDPINIGGNVANSTELFGPLLLGAGDTFSVEVGSGDVQLQNNVLLSLVFEAMPAPIPLPAGGVLLLTVMLAGGYAARRRQTATA